MGHRNIKNTVWRNYSYQLIWKTQQWCLCEWSTATMIRGGAVKLNQPGIIGIILFKKTCVSQLASFKSAFFHSFISLFVDNLLNSKPRLSGYLLCSSVWAFNTSVEWSYRSVCLLVQSIYSDFLYFISKSWKLGNVSYTIKMLFSVRNTHILIDFYAKLLTSFSFLKTRLFFMVCDYPPKMSIYF